MTSETNHHKDEMDTLVDKQLFVQWLDEYGGDGNERIEQARQRYLDEIRLQYFMYTLGISNRQYAKKMLRRYRRDSHEGQEER